MQSLTIEQIGYWEVYDGSAIRELEGSLSGAINGMHISEDGKYFVTGRYLHMQSYFTESFFCHMADVTVTTGGTINKMNGSIYNGAEKHNSQNSWINVCSPGLNKHLQNSK